MRKLAEIFVVQRRDERARKLVLELVGDFIALIFQSLERLGERLDIAEVPYKLGEGLGRSNGDLRLTFQQLKERLIFSEFQHRINLISLTGSLAPVRAAIALFLNIWRVRPFKTLWSSLDADLAIWVTSHTMHHWAQLNYIQSLSGDLEMHW